MQMRTVPPPYSAQVAKNMLNRFGLAAIWRLHLSAAAAHRQGKALAARSIIEIADAAEEEWWRRQRADRDGVKRPRSGSKTDR